MTRRNFLGVSLTVTALVAMPAFVFAGNPLTQPRTDVGTTAAFTLEETGYSILEENGTDYVQDETGTDSNRVPITQARSPRS